MRLDAVGEVDRRRGLARREPRGDRVALAARRVRGSGRCRSRRCSVPTAAAARPSPGSSARSGARRHGGGPGAPRPRRTRRRRRRWADGLVGLVRHRASIPPSQSASACAIPCRPISARVGWSTGCIWSTTAMCSAQACARRQVASSCASRSRNAAAAVGVEREPGGRQVGRRVAGGHVAEVDDRAQPAVVHQQVGGVRVAVQPQRRAVPRGRGGQVAPALEDAVGLGQRRAAPAARAAAARAARSARRGTGSPGRRPGRGGAARRTPRPAAAPTPSGSPPGCGGRRRRRTTGRRSTSTGRSTTARRPGPASGTSTGSRGARTGSQRCSWSTSGAATARTGNRAARWSPTRHSALSHPVPAQVRGRSARSGCCSRSSVRARSAVTSISGTGCTTSAGLHGAVHVVRHGPAESVEHPGEHDAR